MGPRRSAAGVTGLGTLEEHKAMYLPSPVETRAACALKQSSYPGLRRLNVQRNDDALVISGTVSTYYLKQLAQECLMPVRGELALVNRVTVSAN